MIKESDVSNLMVAGRVAEFCMNQLANSLEPGMCSLELDRRATDIITKAGGTPAFKTVKNYPYSICFSVNPEIVHGIPEKGKTVPSDKPFTIDLGVEYKGLYVDHAKTFYFGKNPSWIKFINQTRNILNLAIQKIKPGLKIRDLSQTIYMLSRIAGYNVPHQFMGHGLHYGLHTKPAIPNTFAHVNDDILNVTLEKGMCLAIEPVLLLGDTEIVEKSLNLGEMNRYLIRKNQIVSAHFEHSVYVTDTGCTVLTNKETNSL